MLIALTRMHAHITRSDEPLLYARSGTPYDIHNSRDASAYERRRCWQAPIVPLNIFASHQPKVAESVVLAWDARSISASNSTTRKLNFFPCCSVPWLLILALGAMHVPTNIPKGVKFSKHFNRKKLLFTLCRICSASCAMWCYLRAKDQNILKLLTKNCWNNETQ